jgi:type II secretory pathway component GspD/PulD (secretin)
MRSRPACLLPWCPILGGLAITWIAMFPLCATAFDEMGKADEPARRKEESAAPPRKTYAFQMRTKPWAQVIEWFADITGMPFVGTEIPQGTFNFIGSSTKAYTVPEIVDIINEALISRKDSQKYILVRRARSFTLVPVDESTDLPLMPRLTVAELDTRGDTELASVVVPLKSLVTADTASAVKKLMGPFGKLTVIEPANQMVLQDTAGILKRICKTIEEIERKETNKTLLIPLIAQEAVDAVRTLQGMFGDSKRGAPYIEADAGRNAIIVGGTNDQVEDIKAVIKSISEADATGSGDTRFITLKPGSGAAVADALEHILREMGKYPVKVIDSTDRLKKTDR